MPADQVVNIVDFSAVSADLIIRLKKWIHDNEAELKKGMSAIRQHLSLWGMGLGPPRQKWQPEKTSNNIRPKPIRRPSPTQKPHPLPKFPSYRPEIPRWNRKPPRLSKSPYDPDYFRRHQRVGRSISSSETQRHKLISESLDILSHLFSLSKSGRRSPELSEKRMDEFLEGKKREYDHMTTEELKSLLKLLHETQQNVELNKAGEITVNGKPVNIENIDVCCPFG